MGAPLTALMVAGYAGLQGWQLSQGQIDAATLKRKVAMFAAGSVGGWLGSAAGVAISDRLPILPQRVRHIVGGAIGGPLGARALLMLTRMLLPPPQQPA
jgi:hypothetical protein